MRPSNAISFRASDARVAREALAELTARFGQASPEEADVIVAGSVGPTGEIMEPMGSLSHASAVEMFHEQAEGLKEGGVDVLWVETISAPEEYKAAARAAELARECARSFDVEDRKNLSHP